MRRILSVVVCIMMAASAVSYGKAEIGLNSKAVN